MDTHNGRTDSVALGGDSTLFLQYLSHMLHTLDGFIAADQRLFVDKAVSLNHRLPLLLQDNVGTDGIADIFLLIGIDGAGGLGMEDSQCDGQDQEEHNEALAETGTDHPQKGCIECRIPELSEKKENGIGNQRKQTKGQQCRTNQKQGGADEQQRIQHAIADHAGIKKGLLVVVAEQSVEGNSHQHHI